MKKRTAEQPTQDAYRQRRRRVENKFHTAFNRLPFQERVKLALTLEDVRAEYVSDKTLRQAKQKSLTHKRVKERNKARRTAEINAALTMAPKGLDKNINIARSYGELDRCLASYRRRQRNGTVRSHDAPNEFLLLRGKLIEIGRRAGYEARLRGRGAEVGWYNNKGELKYIWALRQGASWKARRLVLSRKGCWRVNVVYDVNHSNVATYGAMIRHDYVSNALHTVLNLTDPARFKAVVDRFRQEHPVLTRYLTRTEEAFYGKALAA